MQEKQLSSFILDITGLKTDIRAACQGISKPIQLYKVSLFLEKKDFFQCGDGKFTNTIAMSRANILRLWTSPAVASLLLCQG